MARFTLPRDIYYGPWRDRRVKKSEGLQKGDDPDRWQLYEKRRFFAEG